MKEKNNDEQSFHEYEDEPNLHGMPETLSLLKNFRTKLKDDEIKRRERKKKVFESESTQTLAQNFAQISPKMLLKLIFIQMCMLAFVTIFVWYLSAFVNGRKNNDLSNLIFKEKLNELRDLEKQMKECRTQNEYLVGEIRVIENQCDINRRSQPNDEATKLFNIIGSVWTVISPVLFGSLTISGLFAIPWCCFTIMIHFLNPGKKTSYS